MEPAPLPPHERTWRHPSELSPTIADVEMSTAGRGLIIATGAAAVLLAAVMVVALTPPRSSTPTALTATTLSGAVVRVQNEARLIEDLGGQGLVRLDRNMVSRDHALTLSGAPKAVSAAPVDAAHDLAVADVVPHDDERIVVLTPSYAYALPWGLVDRLLVPDGATVITRHGELIAVFVEGELRLLVN